MNRPEVERFLMTEAQGLWPQWEPTDAELRVWTDRLGSLDYATARRAAQMCFSEQTVNYHRPVLGRFLEKARALARPAGGPGRRAPEPTTDVFVECTEPPAGRPQLRGVRRPVYVAPPARQGEPEYVWACAQSLRRQVESLYGGGWLVVRTRRPDPDDGRRGEPARRQACRRILAGPATPGQRWLQNRPTPPDRGPGVPIPRDIALALAPPADAAPREAE